MQKILRTIAGVLLVLGFVCGGAHAQSRGNANLGWSGAWTPPSASDQALLNQQALVDFDLAHGVLNPGGSTTYNGPVSQTYTGPVSNSGSSVTNIGNLNSSTVTTTANNSTVTSNLSSTQRANNATQSGSADANSSTGTGTFNAGDTLSAQSH